MRLNIEERFWITHRTNLIILARANSWNEFEATGRLIHLWRESQSAGVWSASAPQICVWAGIYEPAEQEVFIASMLDPLVNFLRHSAEPETYDIAGCKSQIVSAKKYLDQRSRAGRASGERRKATAVERALNITEPITSTSTSTNTKIKKREIKDARGDSPSAQTPPPINSDLKLGDPVPEKKRKRKTSTQKPRIKTWEPDNRFARSFTLLNTLEPYRACFDVPMDSAKLESHMDQYKLSLVEIDKHIYEFVHYYKDVVHKLQNPRGRLSTWLSKAGKWRDDDLAKQKDKPLTGIEYERQMGEEYKQKHGKYLHEDW